MNPQKKFLVYISYVKTASCIWSSITCALTYDYVKARATDDSRYTFSAKEKDDETQYSYFGARYYDSDLSVWLSVDPACNEYPSTSPFMYVRGNPVRLTDPNGMWDSDHIDEVGNIIAHYDDGDKSVYAHKNGTTQTQIDKQRIDNNNTGGTGKKIGELGGNINVSGIMENKLAQSANEAKGMNIVDYFFVVQPGGDWDLKNKETTIWGAAWGYDQDNGTRTTFNFGDYGGMSAADVGNYHAGYTGKYTYGGEGMSDFTLAYAAGLAESYKSLTKGDFLKLSGQILQLHYFAKPYGDNRRDYYFNHFGMQDAEKNQNTGQKAGQFRR